MSKFLYPIYKLKTKSYIKWWLYNKKAGGSGVLSEILEGFSFNLENTLNRKFNLFEIEGNSVQDGSPSPDNEVPILSSGDNGSINEKIQTRNLFDKNEIVENYRLISNGTLYADNLYLTSDFIKILSNTNYVFNRMSGSECICEYDKNKNNIGRTIMGSGSSVTTTSNTAYVRISILKSKLDVFQFELGSTATSYVPHEEQDYSIYTQQPMRSIGDVRDGFAKVNGNWFERHLPYIASYNGETLPTDVYTEEGGIKYCNSKSMSTTGQFSNGASVQYVDENNWNYLPCTEEQIQQLENKPSTYKDFTIIQSQDETPAHLKIQYYKEG